jgi:hypothetical protein
MPPQKNLYAERHFRCFANAHSWDLYTTYVSGYNIGSNPIFFVGCDLLVALALNPLNN